MEQRHKVNGSSERAWSSVISVNGSSERAWGSFLSVNGSSERAWSSVISVDGSSERAWGRFISVNGSSERAWSSVIRELSGSLSIDDGDRSEDVTFKMNSLFFLTLSRLFESAENVK